MAGFHHQNKAVLGVFARHAVGQLAQVDVMPFIGQAVLRYFEISDDGMGALAAIAADKDEVIVARAARQHLTRGAQIRHQQIIARIAPKMTAPRTGIEFVIPRATVDFISPQIAPDFVVARGA